MLTRKIDKSKWKNLLNNNRHSIFQTLEWAEIIENDEWHPVCLVNNDWSGGILFMENNSRDAYESMALGCYGGNIGKQLNLCEMMSTDLHYIRIFDYYGTTSCDGWDKFSLTTHIIDTDNYRLSRGRSDDLRVAKLAGVRIEETTDVEKFYHVFENSMKFFPDTEYIKPKEMFEKMIGTGYAKLQLGYIGEKEIGCAVHLFYKDEIFCYVDMVLPEFRKSGFITKSVEHTIERYPEYKQYNFGAGVSEGTTKFKKSWGGREHKYNIYGITFKTKYEYI